jgi:hypothetical protein
MFNTLGHWWTAHRGEVGKCGIIVLGALVWYVGRELMERQRLPFVSAESSAHPAAPNGQPS